jgi:protoporphyrinogen oxidase
MNDEPAGIAGAYAALSRLQIPQHWSAEQALAVWELLDELITRLWNRYELPLIKLIRADRCDNMSVQTNTTPQVYSE